ncbi:MAG: DUF485 domain-containing protein [Pseudonocardiaceae bacterium]|nr:DUF485 domain-containing protein [Pseudonocardiaceae bacterium]
MYWRCGVSTEHGGSGTQSAGTEDPWVTAQRSPEFAQLRRGLRRFIFPMTAFFLIWYFAYVALAAFAPGFMAIPVLGNINVGLVIGLLQFVSTFLIATLYVRYANKNLDPVGRRIRERLEGGAQ